MDSVLYLRILAGLPGPDSSCSVLDCSILACSLRDCLAATSTTFGGEASTLLSQGTFSSETLGVSHSTVLDSHFNGTISVLAATDTVCVSSDSSVSSLTDSGAAWELKGTLSVVGHSDEVTGVAPESVTSFFVTTFALLTQGVNIVGLALLLTLVDKVLVPEDAEEIGLTDAAATSGSLFTVTGWCWTGLVAIVLVTFDGLLKHADPSAEADTVVTAFDPWGLTTDTVVRA